MAAASVTATIKQNEHTSKNNASPNENSPHSGAPASITNGDNNSSTLLQKETPKEAAPTKPVVARKKRAFGEQKAVLPPPKVIVDPNLLNSAAPTSFTNISDKNGTASNGVIDYSNPIPISELPKMGDIATWAPTSSSSISKKRSRSSSENSDMKMDDDKDYDNRESEKKKKYSPSYYENGSRTVNLEIIPSEESLKKKQDDVSLANQEKCAIKGYEARYNLMNKLMHKNKSSIVCLRNMVTLSDIDDLLENEIKGECSKYGRIKDLCLFNEPGTTNIRIFLCFSLPSEADFAQSSLNKRYFGGRMISATIYDQVLYQNNDFMGACE